MTDAVLRSLVAIVALASTLSAQDMSVRTYDVVDGLPGNRVTCIFQDSKGYLWVATWDGVARFDGAEFHAYDATDGLANFLVNTVTEDRDGHLWVGTQDGIARFLDDPRERTGASERASASDQARRSDDARGSQQARARDQASTARDLLFESHRVGSTTLTNQVNQILFDARGEVWCSTDGGILRARRTAEPDLDFTPAIAKESAGRNGAAFLARDERLWFGVGDELCGFGATAATRHALGAGAQDGNPLELLPLEVMSVAELPGGELFVAARTALFRTANLQADAHVATNAQARLRFEPWATSLEPGQTPLATLVDSRGTLWIGTNRGLVRCSLDGRRVPGTAARLADDYVTALCEDRDGNIWVGTRTAGIAKLSRNGVATMTEADGLPHREVARVVEGVEGEMYAVTPAGIAEVRDETVHLVAGSDRAPFSNVGLRILLDRAGDWWLGTDVGLFRVRGPKLELERADLLDHEAGLPPGSVYGCVAEDARGRVWLGMSDSSVCSSDPRPFDEPRFTAHAPAELGLDEPLREILGDSTGTMWLAPYRHVVRYRDGRATRMELVDSLHATQPRAVFEDKRGWIWIATRYDGVYWSREPRAEKPAFEKLGTQGGLASDAAWSITEDGQGRMYFATGKGVDRYDPQSRRVRHFSVFEGLAANQVNQVLTDRQGRVWAATTAGLSRIDPGHELGAPAPFSVYLTRVQLAGEDLLLPERGARDGGEATLDASRNNLSFEFVAPSFHGERELAYRYKLEGVDRDWSAPSAHRSVHYANLSSGDYHFLVRAEHPAGMLSSSPAEFRFHITPPVWRRAWFLASVAAVAGIAVYALHKARVRRLLALEQMRSQIATDIHDDVGSGLSEITILAEVLKRGQSADASRHLTEIARLSRSLRDSMGDIVWAVDPRKDRFVDLVQRMRQVAYNSLEAEGVRVELDCPSDASLANLGLAPDRRRHLFLIFKEAITNVARHAGASVVHIRLEIAARALRLTIEDDGRGFDATSEHAGQGLKSLQRRASLLGGTLEIRSLERTGTRIELAVSW